MTETTKGTYVGPAIRKGTDVPIIPMKEFWGDKIQRSVNLPELAWDALDEVAEALKLTRNELIEEMVRESLKATAEHRKLEVKALKKVRTL